MKKLMIYVKKIPIIMLGGLWIAYGLIAVQREHLVDFTAFYGAANNILLGLTPYGFYETFYGTSSFQSPIWLGWFFVPFTLLSINRAFIIFGYLNLILCLVCVLMIFRSQSSKVTPLDFPYLLGCAFVLSFMTIQFGQVTIIQLAAVILTIIALHMKKPIYAGLTIPLIIIKPHLVIYFLFAALRRGGRKMLLAGIGSTSSLMLIAFMTQPSWITDMLQAVIIGQQNSIMELNKFVTLGGLFSLPFWLNISIWLLSLPILILVDHKFRSLPSNIWLPITLVLSLATAPYAFAYDLPLLIPALIWASLPLSPLSFFIVFTVASIAILTGFSSFAYIAVIIVALFSIRFAINQMHTQVNEPI